MLVVLSSLSESTLARMSFVKTSWVTGCYMAEWPIVSMAYRNAPIRLAPVMCGLAVLFSMSAALGQALTTGQMPLQIEPAKPLALPPQVGQHRQLNSTAFFVDGQGHLLTVRHAVENCGQVVIAKDQHRVSGRIVAVSSRYDLALLKVPRTLGLAAVFPRSVAAITNDMMFAGAYDTLPGMRSGGGMLANSRVVSSFGGSEDGHLVIDSSVTFGASGAPVLDKNGLVQGVISRRTMINRVLAVGVAPTKAFLASNGVQVEQDDRPQLAGSASRANRAASVSARVTCLQN
jgi:serine protease Do